MQQISMQAQKREQITKGKNRRLRMAGDVPAIIYGPDGECLPISVNYRDLHKNLSSSAGLNILITLDIQGANQQTVIVKNIQREPLVAGYRHVDFYRISMDKELRTFVPVVAVGIPEGVKLGGILEFILREVEVECLPALIPERIEVDAVPLQINASIHIADLKLPEGVKVLGDDKRVVLSVVPPVAEEVAAVVAEVAEPEVIEKGKKEEEGEAGAEGDAKSKAKPDAEKKG